MRVLLDTDVVLDLIMAREPFADDAAALWIANERADVDAVISPITPVNVFYVVRKLRGAEVARRAVDALLGGLHVCTVDEASMHLAATLAMGDFEDAAQVAAALRNGADAIVTRNGSDYTGCPLPVFAPADLLRRIAGL